MRYALTWPSGKPRSNSRSTATTTTSERRGDENHIVSALARQLIPHADLAAIGRVPEGVSTRVYRIPAGTETFYLRVLPEEEESFAPEALAHALLIERGVRVPRVVYWERRHSALDRSVMVTAEIAGEPLSRAASRLSAPELRAVLVEAGRDLALLNGVPVAGFGWVRRDAAVVTQLEGEHPTMRAFALEYLDADLNYLRESRPGLLDGAEIAVIRDIIGEREHLLDVSHARLAHGDFDVTPIFVANGRYSGIIDLGELRGADPLYDLAHFKLHDGETLPPGLLPPLLEGCASACRLPPDYARRLELLTLLIGIRALARRLAKRGRDDAACHLLRAIRREIATTRHESL